ncbi:hypothetical protein [Alloactinosynnema sp. L-07]|nr:hypothetical protein [Alloactinosynnema sp. L-07]
MPGGRRDDRRHRDVRREVRTFWDAGVLGSGHLNEQDYPGQRDQECESPGDAGVRRCGWRP